VNASLELVEGLRAIEVAVAQRTALVVRAAAIQTDRAMLGLAPDPVADAVVAGERAVLGEHSAEVDEQTKTIRRSVSAMLECD
jgi:hypothetical protein